MRTIDKQKVSNSSKVKIAAGTVDVSSVRHNDAILSPEKQAKYDEILRVSGHPEDALKRLIAAGKLHG